MSAVSSLVLASLSDLIDPQKLLSSGGYLLLFAIIFAESGLLIGFFLPGDSLLFTAGAIAAGAFDKVPALAKLDFNVFVLMAGCFVAAVAGDQVGYLIGNKAGPKIFDREDSRFFKREYVDKGTEFFTKYGGKAVIMARFVPVVRTFVPTIAGVSDMHYSKFLRFNLVGGFIWACGVVGLGYAFGNIEFVKNNFEIVIFAVIGISLLPVIVEFIRSRKAAGTPAS